MEYHLKKKIKNKSKKYLIGKKFKIINLKNGISKEESQ